mmetsp:Transcript_59463/g.158121  ORF Transcript_59463/g.158121 Transcript_59463/m.158121 type:complete len:149 (-) Transcript_59463:172-618(-)
MMRNLPYSFTRQTLLELLNTCGFEGQYDFVYLPFDYDTACHLGYSFVNLISPWYTVRFFEVFNGFSSWGPHRSHRVCNVCFSSIQGLSANIARHRNGAMDDQIPEEYKPVLFRDGLQIPFMMVGGKPSGKRGQSFNSSTPSDVAWDTG